MGHSKKPLIKSIKRLKKTSLGRLDRFILALLVVGVLLLSVYVFTIPEKIYQKGDVASLLPAVETVAFVEFNDMSISTKLKNSPAFNQKTWASSIEKWFGVDYAGISSSWSREGFGIALLQSESGVNYPVFFGEVRSKRKILEAFEGLALADEKLIISNSAERPIYSYPQGHSFHFTFSSSYVFISNHLPSLEVIQTVYDEEESLLGSQNDYIKSAQNLPKQTWMRGYVNLQSLYFKNNFTANSLIEPLKFAVNHIAWTVKKDPNGFHFNTFTNLNKKLLSLKSGSIDPGKFAHRLTDYINPKNLSLYAGGEDLSSEWQNTLDTIANLNPAYGIILESIIRAQVTRIFGEEVSLRNDIYPLFEGEYAFAIGNKDGKNQLRLLLAHNNRRFVNKKLAKLIEGFRYLSAQFSPKLHVIELPDGTQSREMIANDERPLEEKITHEGHKIHCVQADDSPTGFCYAVSDDLIMMANDKQGVIEAIELGLSSEFNLSQYQPFRQSLSNVSKVSDELTFIEIQNALPFIESNPYGLLAKPFLEKFEAVSWVKHYFDDGVSTEGYVLIK